METKRILRALRANVGMGMIGSGEVSDFIRTERYLLTSQGMKIGPSVKSRVCRLEYVSHSPKSC